MKNLYFLILAFFFLIGTGKAQFKKVMDCNFKYGDYPWGSLTFSGNKLYGMESESGANSGATSSGTIFSINPDGSGIKDIFDFAPETGCTPNGSLTISGSMMYGMTMVGGNADHPGGCLFSIHTDGTGFKKLVEFTGANGYSPHGSLLLSGNVLYGMTYGGGANQQGNIFSVNTDGSGFKVLYDCPAYEGGIYPFGDLIISGNILYGMFSQSAKNGVGCIFSIHTDGTNYKDIFDFDSKNGGHPLGSLTLSGNVLYGMTERGGAGEMGCVFSVHTDGSSYKDLLDFNGLNNGAHPAGSLLLLGSVLYGITYDGGERNDGNIFSIHTDGSGYVNLHSFDYNDGASPRGNLVLAGNTLFGTAQSGGGGLGSLFSYQLSNPVK